MILTRNYQAKILHNITDLKCRVFALETIFHLISLCSIFKLSKFKTHHDKVGQYFHWTTCHHYGIKIAANWYEHHPEYTVDGAVISINTDRTIQYFPQTFLLFHPMKGDKVTRIKDLVGWERQWQWIDWKWGDFRKRQKWKKKEVN